jgi:hypothetical protein
MISCYRDPFPSSRFPTISDIVISPITGFGGGELCDYVLLPDGKAIINYYGEKINIRTGNISRPFDGNGIFVPGNALHMSLDGKYLSGVKTYYDPDLNRIDYIFDLSTQKITQYWMNGGIPAISWAPDHSRFLVSDYKTLVSVPDMKQITDWDKSVEFSNITNTSGDGMFLWDKKQNIPVAAIRGCGIYCQLYAEFTDKDRIEWGLISINDLTNSQDFSLRETITSIQLPNAVVDWTFDPSGRYVLLSVWEQSKMSTDDDQPLSVNVTDSVLLLMDWKTKQSVELARLSKIDKFHLVAQPATIRWSSDGSTILWPREGAGALVLGIQYQ